MNTANLIGKRFGKLTVHSFSHIKHFPSGQHQGVWNCTCDCGCTTQVTRSALVSRNTKSCGCGKYRTTHGLSNTPTYQAWADMWGRCTNQNHRSWRHYGGRGILVCDHWVKFENFVADVGIRPDGLTLERVNNELGYFPGNVIWATMAVQLSNKRNSVKLTAFGKTQHLSAWSRERKLDCKTISYRLGIGMSVEMALGLKSGSIFRGKLKRGLDHAGD